MQKLFTLNLFSLLFFSIFTLNFMIGENLQAQSEKPEKIMIFNGEQWKSQLYGFMKLDAVYNDSQRVVNTTSPLFVSSEKPDDVDARKSGSFVMSARTSRLGFKIWGPKVFGDGVPMARVEFDFWGDTPTSSGMSVRQSQMRLRLAYVQIDWPTKTYLLAGNQWMLGVPFPVAPDQVTFIPLPGAGFLFMREPQIAVGQSFGNKEFSTKIEASVSTPQGNDGIDSSADYFNPGPRGSQLYTAGVGEASEQPSYKARLTFNINPMQGVNIILGGSGQYMTEQHSLKIGTGDTDADYTTKDVDSWYGQFFASFSYNFVSLMGHYFQGENIDQYFGGIFQGVTKENEGSADASIKAVKSAGYWAQLRIDLRKLDLIPFTFSFGYGQEKVDEDTIADSGRSKNSNAWANFWWYWNANYRLGFEVTKIQTEYKDPNIPLGDDFKYHLAFQYSF